jgi:hypothetical protein
VRNGAGKADHCRDRRRRLGDAGAAGSCGRRVKLRAVRNVLRLTSALHVNAHVVVLRVLRASQLRAGRVRLVPTPPGPVQLSFFLLFSFPFHVLDNAKMAT